MNHGFSFLPPVLLLIGLLATVAVNFTDQSLKAARSRYAQSQTIQQRKVLGNPSDQIGIAELPGYTGWNRNRHKSKVDQCFVIRIGTQAATIDGYVNIFHYNLSSSTSSEWTVSIACPNITAPVEQGHLSSPLFYARAYGPAIVVGSQKNNDALSFMVQDEHYSTTDISFAIKDPGVYTVEVVLESIFTPNVYTLPRTPQLEYGGFILRGFPWILNVTSSHNLCSSVKSCNLTFCRSKDVEADFSSSSGRWIVLGHTKRIRNKLIVDYESMNDPSLQNYMQGSNRLSIETVYNPISCMLTPLISSIASLDACADDRGIHYIFIGDSVTRQHYNAMYNLLHPPNQVTMVDLGGKISFCIVFCVCTY